MIMGCAIAAGVACLLGCCVFGAMALGCGGLMNVGQTAALGDMSRTMHAATPGHPRAAEYEQELQRFDALQPSIGFLTFGILSNRYNAAYADGVIDAAELDHLMLLVTDIDASGGNVDMARYPGGT